MTPTVEVATGSEEVVWVGPGADPSDARGFQTKADANEAPPEGAGTGTAVQGRSEFKGLGTWPNGKDDGGCPPDAVDDGVGRFKGTQAGAGAPTAAAPNSAGGEPLNTFPIGAEVRFVFNPNPPVGATCC